MVAALAGREPARPVNRKRVQRLMREHALLQPAAAKAAGGGPGSSRSPAPTSSGIST